MEGDIAEGYWSWTDASADQCVYIALMPTSITDASGQWLPVDPEETDRLVWLDAREPAVLTHGEAIIGYAAVDDVSAIVSREAQPQCFLELVGTYANPGDYYQCRHLVSGSVRGADGRWMGVELSSERHACVYATRGG